MFFFFLQFQFICILSHIKILLSSTNLAAFPNTAVKICILGLHSRDEADMLVNKTILGFHPRNETAMLVYKTMAKCRSSFA